MKSLLIKCVLALLLLTNAAFAADSLPSWNDTAPKKAIVAFVEKVTKPDSQGFVPVENASPPLTTTARSGRNSRWLSSYTLSLTASKFSRRSIRSGKARNLLPPCSKAT